MRGTNNENDVTISSSSDTKMQLISFVVESIDNFDKI